MSNWIDTKYPIGLDVEVLDEGTGIITNHTEEFNVENPGTHTSGIIVSLDAGGYVEVEGEFLNEDGTSGVIVQVKK